MKTGKIKSLSFDIETYSSVDLGKCGVYKYAESPDFEILLFGYAVDDGEVKVIDPFPMKFSPRSPMKAWKNGASTPILKECVCRAISPISA